MHIVRTNMYNLRKTPAKFYAYTSDIDFDSLSEYSDTEIDSSSEYSDTEIDSESETESLLYSWSEYDSDTACISDCDEVPILPEIQITKGVFMDVDFEFAQILDGSYLCKYIWSDLIGVV